MTNSLTIYSIKIILKGILATMQDYTKNSNKKQADGEFNKSEMRVKVINFIYSQVPKN